VNNNMCSFTYSFKIYIIINSQSVTGYKGTRHKYINIT